MTVYAQVKSVPNNVFNKLKSIISPNSTQNSSITNENTDKNNTSYVPYSDVAKSIADANKNFIVKNPLSVDLTGVDKSKIDNEGLDLDDLFAKNKEQVTEAIDKIYKRRPSGYEQNLKWVDLPAQQLETNQAEKLQKFVDENVRGKYSDLILDGIGGSSLGAKATINALIDSQWNSMSDKERNGYPRIHFVENIDPDRYSELVDKLDLKKTLVLVTSNSGRPSETLANYLNLQERFRDEVAKGNMTEEELKKHIIAVTNDDPTKSLLKEQSIANGYQTFGIPDDLNSRVSAFSNNILVPAAMVGIDLEAFLKGAANMSKLCGDTKNIRTNPAAAPALVHKTYYDKGKPYSVFMPYSDKMADTAGWHGQLWAEHLGKKFDKDGNVRNFNYTPIKSLGAIDQHSQFQLWREGGNDKVITIIRTGFNRELPIAKNQANIPDSIAYMKHNSYNDLMKVEADTTKEVLMGDKRPVISIDMPKLDAYHYGALLQMYMTQTALVGELSGLGVNTFREPAVKDLKRRHTDQKC